ncbi:hypothetical protein [Desulfocurvibacter africanus]|uniref:DUF5666 domain-containing protein n=1 Tax=Desulfocurvibacter africanus subsp. africanus str. Walvis Bay TaxID=690850 RepID=F3YW46_DESAF|nr:hypothetical protein [Desulfocurvibacter africanus]EGJ49076.1 hypothetical protein Desaf_0725 [Desulfocurvibacter africanus subsp. africanus str. Walvis Bay]
MIRKFAASFALLALGVLLFAASAYAGEVAQGKCLNYTKGGTLVIEEYDTNFTPEMKYGHPTGIESSFDASKAKVGMIPEPGDILRIAYDADGSSKRATKIMNVSKQDLRKK